MVRDERPHAAHIRLKRLDELQILRQRPRRLAGRAHHEPAARLEADRLQSPQAAHAVFKGHFMGVQFFIVRPVRRLMAQQVAVRARLVHAAVIVRGILAQRQGDGAVGVCRADARNDPADAPHRHRALAALQHERAEPQLVSLRAAGQDGLLVQRVAVAAGVRSADAAVEAVVPADVAHLDQAADVHVHAVHRAARSVGKRGGVSGGFAALPRNQRLVFLQRQPALRRQTVDQAKHPPPRWNRRS